MRSFSFAIALLLTSTVVSAQRYSGSLELNPDEHSGAGLGATIFGHGILQRKTLPLVLLIDLSVDDAQNVTFHEISVSTEGRIDLQQDVYVDLIGDTMMSGDTIDLNPIGTDNIFDIQPFIWSSPLNLSGAYANRNFENEFSEAFQARSGINGDVGFQNYPESLNLRLAASVPFQGSAELEPELFLRSPQMSFGENWVIELLPVPPAEANVLGDSNLDGIFNSADLVQVFSAGEYEDNIPFNSTWEEGDWNSDLDFDSSDLVFVFSEGGYSASAFTVPEPHSPFSPIVLVAIILFLKHMNHSKHHCALSFSPFHSHKR